MATYLRPGVNIVENLTALTTPFAPATAVAIAAFVGVASRGPVVPTMVRSWTDFQSLFGSFSNSTYLAYAAYTYFLNGGPPAWMQRVVSASGPVAATRVVLDQAGTPLSTMGITAANVGAWGNGITFDIGAGYTTGRFNLTIKFGGAAVEQYNDISIVSTDARYCLPLVNNVSRYVVLTNLNSVTVAPANNPAVQTGTTLATGADGTAPASTDFTPALALLPAITQPIVLNLPGVTDSATLIVAQAFVASVANVFLVIDSASGASVSAVETFAASLTPTTYAAVYYPWYSISDPNKPASQGATVSVAPGGAVVGNYMSADATKGPFQTPAGVNATVSGATALALTLQPSDYDSLNSSIPPVNALKSIPSYGICVFGGRTLQGGYPSLYIAVRRSLIYIEATLLNLTQSAVFQPNDGVLWETLTTEITTWLTSYFGLGGLAGATAAQAFFVTCDATNNTPATVQAGIVNVAVGVALQFPAEFITITIGQYQGGSTVTNTLN